MAARLGPAEVRFTGRAEGDLRPGPITAEWRSIEAGLAERRAAVTCLPWTWLTQVHGTKVITVDRPGDGAGAEADAVLTTARRAAVAVATADCAPIVLADADAATDAVAVVHAGWRGLAGGVLDAAVAALRAAGSTKPVAALGPCIHAACYEFGADDLDRVAARIGDAARGVTAAGKPALDLPAAVETVLGTLGVEFALDVGVCTACDPDYFSHRARGDVERQATVAWLP